MRKLYSLLRGFNRFRKSSSGRTVHNHFIFESDNPHPQSWAARLLLKNELRIQDVDYLADELWVWLEFRENYLKEVLAKGIEKENIWKNLGLGLALLLAIPMAAILSFVTMIGWPLGIMFLMLYVLEME